MNTSGSRWSATGRALAAFAALVPVVFFMACGADRISGLRPVDGPALSAGGTGGVVISQIYGAGGNSGSVLSNDYVELYNPGPADVSLATWSVQYTSASGTGNFAAAPLRGFIPAGHYYLVQLAGTSGASLPGADATGTLNMSGTAGKVALVNQLAALPCNGGSTACTADQLSHIVDLVGYGSANFFEGAGPAPAASTTLAVFRKSGGTLDTDNNANDFETGAPAPRSSSYIPPGTTLTATVDPATKTLDPGTPFSFTVSASKGTKIAAISSTQWVSSDPAVATIDPASGAVSAIAPGTTTITATVVTDLGTASGSATLTVTGVAPPSQVIISQVYGGGGNNGSTLKNDFIELYNNGTTDVDLNDWSVQYGSSKGDAWSETNKTRLTGTIKAGHYFLVQESAGSGGTVNLPTPDVIGTILVGGTTGTIALVRKNVALSGVCPKDDFYVADFVGYGATTCARGTPTATLSASTAAMRISCSLANPASNTNNNGADFRVVEPVPHNGTQTPPAPGDAVSITVAPDVWSLRLTQTKVFDTAILGADKSPVCSPITWTSSNPAVATVDPVAGLVTAKGLGTVTITATAPNNVAGTATVSVIIGNVTVQPRSDALPVGFQTQLFLNNGSTDSNNNPVGNSDITWSSSNPAIVSVNASTGVITANGLGRAVITGLSRTDGLSTGSTTIVTSTPEFAAGARVGHNTELGVPVDADASDDILIARREYTTSYNPRRGVTNWVSWNLDASHKGSLARCNCMTADTALVRLGLPAYDTNDWINNGSNGAYSRGHMSPSADWNVATGDNATTFFLTNMLPQNQDLNGGPWGALEDTLRLVAGEGKELYIIAGGVFTHDRRGSGIDGFGTISNAGKIAIPDSIWKIAIIVPDTRAASGIVDPGDVQVIAINAPNEKPAPNATWHDYATTIDKIQRSTGYDFLSALPEGIQCRLEARNCAPTAHLTGAGLAGGVEGQTLTFDASTSTDQGGPSALHYEWSVDGQVVGTDATLAYAFPDNGTYQVRVVATNTGGASDAATASVTITNVAPSVGALAAATIDEGSVYSASGSFTDPGDDHWSATVDYGDGSGAQPLTLAGKSFSLSHTYAASGPYTVTVTVRETDAEAGTGAQTAIITVTNVAPVVATFAGATILRGESYTAAGTFTDPGADTWTATVNYGDGSGTSGLLLAGQGFSLQHSYTAAGTFTVTVTVTDSDGGASTRTATVTVLSTGDGIATLASTIADLASRGAVQDGDAKWLANKLDIAAKELARGNAGPTRNQLEELIARIDAARAAGRLSSDTAALLTTYANRLLASMV